MEEKANKDYLLNNKGSFMLLRVIAFDKYRSHKTMYRVSSYIIDGRYDEIILN